MNAPDKPDIPEISAHELAAMETALRNRPRATASKALQQRVLAAVGHELRAARTRRHWRIAAGVLFATLTGLNWLSAPPLPDAPNDLPDHGQVQRDAQRLHELLPELSWQESQRQALLWRSAPGLPLVRASLGPRPGTGVDSSVH